MKQPWSDTLPESHVTYKEPSLTRSREKPGIAGPQLSREARMVPMRPNPQTTAFRDHFFAVASPAYPPCADPRRRPLLSPSCGLPVIASLDIGSRLSRRASAVRRYNLTQVWLGPVLRLKLKFHPSSPLSSAPPPCTLPWGHLRPAEAELRLRPLRFLLSYRCNVPLDLITQLVDRCEFFLRADEAHEFHFEVHTVEIAVEVE